MEAQKYLFYPQITTISEKIDSIRKDENERDIILSYRFYVDGNYKYLNRIVSNVLDFFGSIGGLFTFLCVLGQAVANKFSKFEQKVKIFKRIYQINRKIAVNKPL